MRSQSALPLSQISPRALSLISPRVLGEHQHDGGLGLIQTTHSKNFARCSCSFATQRPLSSPSSENNRSNRAIAESSFFFPAGDFCPGVSEHHDGLTEMRHLMKLQEDIERRLDERTDHQRKERAKLENPYGEIGDLVVDRLLLRYLPSRISHARCSKTVLAHLIVDYNLTKPFDEFHSLSGIASLIYEPSNFPFV